MGFFDIFRSKRTEENKAEETPKRLKKRGYAAASTGNLFADFNASNGSADAELRPALARLRERSRDLSRNNDYARRYFNLLKTNVVGDKGFNLQVKAMNTNGDKPDSLGNQAVEQAFKKWGKKGNCSVCGKLSWVDVQRLVLENCARDGEVFIRLHDGNSLHDGFALEVIDPDLIDETKNAKLNNGNEIRMGIEVNRFGRPVAYHIKNKHPGDHEYADRVEAKTTRVDAKNIIHVFQQLRPGQTRGEPWLAPVMNSLKHESALRESMLVAQRCASAKMGFFVSDNNDQFIGDAYEGDVPVMEVSPGVLTQLPAGMRLESWDVKFPDGYETFHRNILQGIASGMGISFASLSSDLSQTSYSSARVGTLEERAFYKDLQCFMVDHFIRPVYERWLQGAMSKASFGIGILQYDKFANAVEVRGRTWPWVDPQKDINAQILALKHGLTSLSAVAQQTYGTDAEELLAQIAKDRELMAQFGVDYALEPFAANFSPIPPEGYSNGNGNDE